MVPRAEFRSYYGLPVLNRPVWKSRDIAGYFFLGGLSGASAVLAAGAHATGRARLATRTKVVAVGSIALSAVALVHDLGVPSRFYNMLRVAKPTSPMSVGSWTLAAYGPAAAVAAASAVSGRVPRVGAAATAGAAALGPVVATYTAALLSDTAVPAWHDAYRELPRVFAGSRAAAAGGAGLVVAPVAEAAPARRLAVAGVVTEVAAAARMTRRLGMVADPYRSGTGGRFVRAGEATAAAGVALAMLGRRHRLASAAGGIVLMASSALTRFGVFHAGIASADDPRYTIEPQRARLQPRSVRSAS